MAETRPIFKQNILLRSLVKIFDFADYETVWKLVCMSFSLVASYPLALLFLTDNPIKQHTTFKLQDLYLVLGVVCTVTVYKFLAFKLLRSFFIWQLDTERFKTLKEREKRGLTQMKLSVDLPIYLLITYAGYQVLKDAPFLSQALFGKGTCHHFIKNYPLNAPVPYLPQYMLVQLGLHLQTLLAHCFVNFYDKKYYEFLLHHGMATFLILMSHYFNLDDVGSVVAFLHDFSDIFLVMLRVYADFRYRAKLLVNVLFVMTAVSWFYTRILFFPWCIIKNTYYQGIMLPHGYIIYFILSHLLSSFIIYLTTQLTMLFIMHCYWFLYLIKSCIFYHAPIGTTKKYDENQVKINQHKDK